MDILFNSTKFDPIMAVAYTSYLAVTIKIQDFDSIFCLSKARAKLTIRHASSQSELNPGIFRKPR